MVSPLGEERLAPIRRTLVETVTRPPSLTGQAGPGERPSPTTARPPHRTGGLMSAFWRFTRPDVMSMTAAAIVPAPEGNRRGDGDAPSAAHFSEA